MRISSEILDFLSFPFKFDLNLAIAIKHTYFCNQEHSYQQFLADVVLVQSQGSTSWLFHGNTDDYFIVVTTSNERLNKESKLQMIATYRATIVWNPASRAPRLAPYFDSVVSLLRVKFWFLGTWSTNPFSRRRMHFKANESALSYLFRELFIPQGTR